MNNSKDKKPAEAKQDPTLAIGFRDLSLSDIMLAALAQVEYIEPTPVQAGTIPQALAGGDLMVQARTGTGKTAAFIIPILERLKPSHKGDSPQALILAPTRELAVQVRQEAARLCFGRKVHCVALYGGKPIRGQITKLQRGAEVIVGTPGRVLDHVGRGTLRLDQISCVVLDEADRMLDIGFRPDIEKILRRCPKQRQTLLFSATVPLPVQRLARRYMIDPVSLNYSPKEVAVETIDQFYSTIEPERKFDLLVQLIKQEDPKQAIIFCRTKRGTDKVSRRLAKKFKSVACIHGDLQQSARDRAMDHFRQGIIRFLVATDVVGRGIDVTGISHIVNYDLPQFCDDYIHRVGRTGRMGREGVAISFVTPEEGNELTRIEMRINRLLKRVEIKGFEALQRPAQQAAADETDKPGLPDEMKEEKPRVPRLKPGGRAPRRIRRAL